MKKKPFIRPDLETIRLFAGDVVVTSGQQGDAGETEIDPVHNKVSDLLLFPEPLRITT